MQGRLRSSAHLVPTRGGRHPLGPHQLPQWKKVHRELTPFLLYLDLEVIVSLLSPSTRASHVASPKCLAAGKHRGAHGTVGERCCLATSVYHTGLV